MSEMPEDSQPKKRVTFVAAVVIAVRSVLPLIIIAGGIYGAIQFNNTDTAMTSGSDEREETARPVETVTAFKSDNPVIINAMGTVIPATEAVIRPRVTGMIERQSDRFVPGGFFKAGDFMLQLDRADYQQIIRQREADLARAQANLKIELGDQAVAQEELDLLDIDIPEINRELILRIPQVNQAEAEVRSAQAALERARLDLQRTTIAAPFNGFVVERNMTAGNNVSAGDALATLVASDRYWVELSVPARDIQWITLPAPDGRGGSRVRIRDSIAWGADSSRDARVTELVTRLDPQSRQGRLIVEIQDPTGRHQESDTKPMVLLNAFVSCEIIGRVLEDSFKVRRDLVRSGDLVWVIDEDNRLVTKAVEVVYRGNEYVYIGAGLQENDRIIQTNLQAPVEQMLLRDTYVAEIGSSPTNANQAEVRIDD